MGDEADIETLMAQMRDELRLEKKSNHIRIAPTAPASFHEREDRELAHRFHQLTNLPYVLPSSQSRSSDQHESDLNDLRSKINLLCDEDPPTQPQPQESTGATKSQKPTTEDPRLLALWNSFQLDSLSDEEDSESSIDLIIPGSNRIHTKELDEDALVELLAQAPDDEEIDQNFLERILRGNQ